VAIIAAMIFGRILQLGALVWVTWVMVSSYVEPPSMLFQFGGLAAGGVVFYLGWLVGGGKQGDG
jgi:hypothetical protein